MSETFCENCREKLPNIFKDLDNIEIQKYFLDLRNYLQDSKQSLRQKQYDEICEKIFEKPLESSKNTKKYNKSSGFLDAVISKLGKYDENDLNEYLKLNQLSLKDFKEIREKLNNYITNNLEKIYELTEKTAHYSLDPKYLKTIAEIKGNVLAQTRLYYKIHRDVNKNTLILGDEGRRNYPPGLNTTATIFSTGSNSLFLGELGSYKDITERNLHTLKNYHMKSTSFAEKGAEFHSLMQIEALRSTASILANSMFFIFLNLEANL